MKKTYNVAKRRKRSGKTNYRKRLKLLISHKPRLVIRISLNNVTVQIFDFDAKGDKVLVSAHSSQLNELGWKSHKSNSPSAYLTGLLLGSRAIQKGIKDAILDIGLKTPTKGSKIFACLKGVVDAGLNIPLSKEILPSNDRISGKHISDFAVKLQKDNPEMFKKQFSLYIKNNIDLSQLSKIFDQVKSKIIKVE